MFYWGEGLLTATSSTNNNLQIPESSPTGSADSVILRLMRLHSFCFTSFHRHRLTSDLVLTENNVFFSSVGLLQAQQVIVNICEIMLYLQSFYKSENYFHVLECVLYFWMFVNIFMKNFT